ncbi:LytTR family DNA-binding domain-containing protein [Marinicauda salina]|uniref:LytTR family DNA-binding domain-containing protein n=1 Tax=Marinicauda salina TaxID=2135793 RepID=UPI001E54A6C4|nr:LytTR family DNA-binding domain-containing protein [Marinicauda salina]
MPTHPLLKSCLEIAALAVGLGTFLAILAPFGSEGLGWPWVWIYWVGLIAVGGAFGFGSGAVLGRVAAGWPAWTPYAVTAVVVSIPITLIVTVVNGLLAGRIRWGEAPILFFFVLVISGFVTLVSWAADRLRERRDITAESRPSRALLDRLPPRLRRARLLALESEDHYLRVRTEAGDALILMRLRDAIAAVEALDGARTHRSWWVARDAVVDARKGDGRGTLVLADGAEAPVSRTYYPALREAGWF